MEEERGLTVRPDMDVFVIPPAQEVKNKLEVIRNFQDLVKKELKEGHDFGKIPGCGDKPTLLKPGAEKIIKLLGLSDQYEIIAQVEDWNKPFFRYLIKCKLVHMGSGVLVSEGLGECNSYESKYRYRWVIEFDVPEGVDKTRIVSKTVYSKVKKRHFTFYRFDNEDIFSQVNTIIKMAKKRAMVDAALSVGRLSELFTQDIEDMGKVTSGLEDSEEDPEYSHDEQGEMKVCPVHHTAMVDGKYGPYCPTKLEDGKWCKGLAPAPAAAAEKKISKEKPGKAENKSNELPYKTDPTTIKDINGLYNAILKDFPDVYKTKASILQAIGKTETEISDPATDYLVIWQKNLPK
jgi:hypothetical protein